MKTIVQLSFSEAKRLGIKKWQMHVDAGGYSDEVYEDKELKCLRGHCGFCERWEVKCKNCEFGKVAGKCDSEGSLFDYWSYICTKENAERILNVIKNLEE